MTAQLTSAEFPLKEYDGFSLPAGEYTALRLVIGDGAGRNWWCVVYPPLCTAAARPDPTRRPLPTPECRTTIWDLSRKKIQARC